MQIIQNTFQNEIYYLLVMLFIAIIISSGLILVFKYGNFIIKIVTSLIGTFLGVTFLYVVVTARFIRGKFDTFSIILGIIGIMLTTVGLSLWKQSYSKKNREN